MTKQDMIEFLMEELGSTMAENNVYDIAEHFYKKWLNEQETIDVQSIYQGDKKYWEI